MGYYNFENKGYSAFVKDYRGNVRADVTEWEGVVERSDYYPYGMQMRVPWSTMWTQPYKFMGKELDRENGWDSYDVHARWLTSPLCQWTTQDPLAEANPWLSPYSYCAGDPINYLDKDGLVRLDAKTRNKYPHLSDYMDNLPQLWTSKDDRFRDLLKLYGGELTDDQMTILLSPGSGPLVVVEPTNARYAVSHTIPSKAGETFKEHMEDIRVDITISPDVAEFFERATENNDSESAYLLLEAVIFHEFTHQGNSHNKETPNGDKEHEKEDSGQRFEKEYYGIPVQFNTLDEILNNQQKR